MRSVDAAPMQPLLEVNAGETRALLKLGWREQRSPELLLALGRCVKNRPDPE
jgi:hypothetical protein